MLAIHERPGSFSDRWITYCDDNNIKYKKVNCYSNDILNQLKDCEGLMWTWEIYDYRAKYFARQLIISAEKMGVKVFPNFNTCWHYEDKIGQKYLLEAVGAPLVPTYVFYDKEKAIQWIENAAFPKVFKLRCGASSNHVKLINNKNYYKKMAEAVNPYGDGKASERIINFLLYEFEYNKKTGKEIK